MRFSGYIITGCVIGLSICVWLTLTHPRTQGDDQLAKASATPAQDRGTPAPTASAGPVAGQASIKLAPFNVSLIAAEPIVDLVYGETREGQNTWAAFTTQTLLAKYPSCKAGALGTLVRSPAPTPSPTRTPSPTPWRSTAPTRTPSNQPFKKIVGGYTYSYRAPTFTCVTDPSGRNDLAAAVAALKNQALPTLSALPAPSGSPSPQASASATARP